MGAKETGTMAGMKNISKSVPRASDRKIRLMYMGPNLGREMLMSGQVFKGGYPPHLTALFGEFPELKKLFIPVEDVMEFKKKLKEPGSEESRLFSAARNREAK
ncbi:MAG: hypothetical protein EOM02_10895 [Synergistales bacterium]|nr:hypothetical protein [Synergistales bacterium]